MTLLNERRFIYNSAAIATNERDLRKYKAATEDQFCKFESEFIELTNNLPNWKTYLTEKQLIISELYVSNHNAGAIDVQLHLGPGTAYHSLFGTIINNKQVGGVFKKLQNAYTVYQKVNLKKGGKKTSVK
jgi:hypothetical protein